MAIRVASHDGEKYYGGLRARYPEGDLRVPWERYSATPVAMPDYGGDFQPYYSRESVRRQIAVFEHEADDVKIASDGLSLDDLNDNIGFAVRWKKSGTWGGFTYNELNPLAKYLYRRALGYGNGRPSNINLRRCRWGSENCGQCFECISNIKENDLLYHSEEELERMKVPVSDGEEQEERKYAPLPKPLKR